MSAAKGARAERWVAQFLERLGIHVLEMNYRCRRGEIDLVAQEGDTLCFVEVRYRSGTRYGTALDTISRIKQQRITYTAQHFLAYAWRGPRCACRFDVVTVEAPEAGTAADGQQPVLRLWRNAFESCEAGAAGGRQRWGSGM